MTDNPLPPGNGHDHLDRPDPEDAWLTALLTELADDPQAPPSTVSPLSVIAAAKRSAADPSPPSSDSSVDPADGAVDRGSADPAAPGRDGVGESTVVELRTRRRRRVLAGLVAAACLFGVGAVVVPLALNSSPSVTSSSSADANRLAEATAESAVAAPDVAGPPNGAAAAESEVAAAQGSVAPEAGGDQEGPGFADSAPSDSGLTEDGALGGCWPLLEDAAVTGLTAVLPANAFGRQVPLSDACDPAAVAGAVLGGVRPETGLVVRVTVAEPGACTVSAGCLPVDGGYLAIDASGSQVAFVYGNGYQVAVGGSAVQAPAGSGLSAEQLVAAAQAVLAALP